jgi:hypothetical protein
MPISDPNAEAPFGALDPTIHRNLILAQRWSDTRDRMLSALLGDGAQRSPLRIAVVRIALIEFGYGRHMPMGHYQHECRRLASSFAVRDEIYRLKSMHMLVTRHPDNDNRVTLITPTFRLINGISRIVPKLAGKIERYFMERADNSK